MMLKSRSIIATPPGATIKEQLVDRGLSQKEFAARMDMSEKHISKLINGEVQLTPDMAVKLEVVLGVPAKFWNNLEAIYREKIIKAKAENEMDADIELVKKLPYREMADHGWVPVTKNLQEQVMHARAFFEVVRLNLIHNPQITRIACRKLSDTEKSDYALIAWAQKARLEARSITPQKISVKNLSAAVSKIRAMTIMNPAAFCPRLTQLLADCGVVVIFLPHIGGSFLHGATFYDGNKIVVGLTLRGKDADKFWFSLFHELAHILYGHITQADGTTDEDEMAADTFARNTLIPPEDFSSFTAAGDFSRDAIIRFADHIRIDCGIVVGRLQKEGLISYSRHNDLKTQYIFTA